MGESRKRITAIPLLQASCGVVCGVCAESESEGKRRRGSRSSLEWLGDARKIKVQRGSIMNVL